MRACAECGKRNEAEARFCSACGTPLPTVEIGDTVFLLASQEDQIRCFERAASWLAEDGVFLVETLVPTVLFKREQLFLVESVETNALRFHIGQVEPFEQRLSTMHVVLDGGIHLYPIRGRYAFPAELDLMARLAGLRLRDRWGSWKRDPVTPQTARQISVYARV